MGNSRVEATHDQADGHQGDVIVVEGKGVQFRTTGNGAYGICIMSDIKPAYLVLQSKDASDTIAQWLRTNPNVSFKAFLGYLEFNANDLIDTEATEAGDDHITSNEYAYEG